MKKKGKHDEILWRNLTLSWKDDRNDKSINTQDTSHNNWYDWLEDQLWLEDSHAWDTYSTLGCTVSCSEVYEESLYENFQILQKTKAAAIPIYPKNVACCESISEMRWVMIIVERDIPDVEVVVVAANNIASTIFFIVVSKVYIIKLY